MKKPSLISTTFLLLLAMTTFSQGIIIDHLCAKLEPIPIWALEKASDSLHIAYGHTSHGSQLMTGITELENQGTNLIGYKGDYYCWNHYQYPGENGPCIEIHDQFRPGDLGHNGDTQWESYTREYLDFDTVSGEINVVMWSWCGGCSDNTVEGINTYLNAMSQLELEYPNIKFVYMTGHLDIWNRDTLMRNNQLIRDYCIDNNKILYDFADIESYNPDGIHYEYAHDNCNYYDEGGIKLGNWAEEYQNSHEEGVYWYYCNAAHSQALNGNLKAYASWWLWCRLIGWEGLVNVDTPTIKDETRVFAKNKTICIESSIPIQATATVFNMAGKKMHAQNISSRKQFMQTNLPAGIYIVQLRGENGYLTSHKIHLP